MGARGPTSRAGREPIAAALSNARSNAGAFFVGGRGAFTALLPRMTWFCGKGGKGDLRVGGSSHLIYLIGKKLDTRLIKGV